MDRRESIIKIKKIMEEWNKDNGFKTSADMDHKIATHIYDAIITPPCFSEGPPMLPNYAPWA